MKHELKLQNQTIEYELIRKRVKNINLRIRRDGGLFVSAHPLVPKGAVDAFLLSKSAFILKALSSLDAKAETPAAPRYTEAEIKDYITALCHEIYPHFERRGVSFPQIKFRKMVSRWGSCHAMRGIVTFNLNLACAPDDCIRYVVLHEFCHFLQANHSPKFYEELSIVCPDWKDCRKKLKDIVLP